MQIKRVLSRSFHSLGLAVLPVVGIFTSDVDKIVFSDVLLPLSICLLIVVLALSALTYLTKNLERSSLAVSIVYFSLFFYGPIASQIFGTTVQGWVSPNSLFLIFWLGFWIFEAYVIAFKIKSPEIFRVFGNVFIAVLLLILSGQALSYHLFTKHRADLIVINSDIKPLEVKVADKPDIYYIVLDSYPSNEILKELYGFDNSEFTNFLEEKGFFVAFNSHSNYPMTYFSLASSLNMGYLSLGPDHKRGFQGFSPLVDLIRNSRVVLELKKMGYQTISFASGYLATEMRHFDHNYSENLICREFSNALLRQTFLVGFDFAGWSLAACLADLHRRSIIWTLATIPFAVTGKDPAFVFAHILAPHAPFVFKKDGSARNIGYFNYSDGNYLRKFMAIETYRKQFIEQLIYINGLVKDSVNKLLADNKRKKVIIIQGDHGPASEVDYTSLEKSNLRERMSILNAIYLDNRNYGNIKLDISPVNNFRAVFRNILHQNISYLSDKSYFVTFKDLYKFTDITNQL